MYITKELLKLIEDTRKVIALRIHIIKFPKLW